MLASASKRGRRPSKPCRSAKRQAAAEPLAPPPTLPPTLPVGLALLLPPLVAGIFWLAAHRASGPGARFFRLVEGTPAQLARLTALLAFLLGFAAVLLFAVAAPPLERLSLKAALTETAAETGKPADLLLARARVLAAEGAGRSGGASRPAPLPVDAALAPVAARLQGAALRAERLPPLLGLGFSLAGGLLGLALARRGQHPRAAAERATLRLLQIAAVTALAVTAGILLSLVFEAWRFFRLVPLHEFLFGLRWEPQIALREDQIAGLGAFGAVPVLLGTFLISAIALLVAGPLGLVSAIWLGEYAAPRLRTFAKPVLELLAGVPTVVYGFFAVVALAPVFRSGAATMGLDLSPNSALVAGFVMGVMILPLVSSLTDDALRSVPLSLREGAFALGATRLETVWRVILPAALPGVVSSFLLAISRALGETMIVLMAAGLIAKLTINPAESVTAVTVQIVTLLTGDTEFDSPKTLSAFALGLLLLLLTLGLNLVALWLSRRWRSNYGI